MLQIVRARQFISTNHHESCISVMNHVSLPVCLSIYVPCMNQLAVYEQVPESIVLLTFSLNGGFLLPLLEQGLFQTCARG